MEETYYDILGITEEEKQLPKNEFEKIVNKKYKKLALKWHPDKWVNASEEEKKTAEDNFKKINEAKETLLDENKRYAYDNGGSYGDDVDDFIKQAMWNMANMGSRMRYRKEPETEKVVVNISMKEAFEGCEKEVTLNVRNGVCNHCHGTGAKDGKTTECHHCHGTGMITEARRAGNSYTMFSRPCPHCHGTGVEEFEKCPECGGTGYKSETIKKKINVIPGIINGMYMVDQASNTCIVFSVEENDGYFERHENNLLHTEKVSVFKALLGFEGIFDTIEGGKIKIKIPECTKNNQAFMVKGKGFPDVNTGIRGDMIIRIAYDYPEKLTSEQKKLLKKLQ